jgi:hypothetical protein
MLEQSTALDPPALDPPHGPRDLDAERLRSFAARIDAIRTRVEAVIGADDVAHVQRMRAASRAHRGRASGRGFGGSPGTRRHDLDLRRPGVDFQPSSRGAGSTDLRGAAATPLRGR